MSLDTKVVERLSLRELKRTAIEMIEAARRVSIPMARNVKNAELDAFPFEWHAPSE